MSSPQAIRNAFASEEFETARRLWEEYAADIEKLIAAGRGSDQVLAEARGLIEWARRSVLSFQAHCSARLASARVAEIYTQIPDSFAHLLRTRL
jgi:hypothetical protein